MLFISIIFISLLSKKDAMMIVAVNNEEQYLL